MNKEMTKGIEIKFNKQDNNYFENEWNNNIDTNILLISLLETINDICEEHDIDTTEILARYIRMGSIDKWATDYEKELMEKLKTF